MKALRAVFLVLLLCEPPGNTWAQEDSDGDLEPESYGYDDDDEEEEEESNMVPGSRGRAPLQCYACQMLHSGENCNQTQKCFHSFCTMLISHGITDVGLLTTYSMWCTDACQPIIRTVSGTQMTQTCCQSTLCNIPPWQSPQIQETLGGRTVSPQGGRTVHPQGGRTVHPQSGRNVHPQDGRTVHPQSGRTVHPQGAGANQSLGGKTSQPQDSGAGCLPGWPKFGGTTFLLSILTSFWASGA